MSNYGSGMGMIFTNSVKQGRNQAGNQGGNQGLKQPSTQTFRALPPIQLQQIRSFPPSGGGFRGMDLGNLKTSKSCGSCGH